MIQAILEIPLDSVQSPTYRDNTLKYKNKKADMCLICGKPIDITDITIEFYHKIAIYNSKITGAAVPIKIKQVYTIINSSGELITVIVSDKYVSYTLNELTLPE